MTERILPNSLEGEKNVLGACLVDADAIHRVRAILPNPGMFHQERHQWIYKAMVDLVEGGTPPDLFTIVDLLEQRGQLKKAGDMSYLTSLTIDVPTSLHAEHYAEVVERDYLRRRAITFGTNVVQRAYKTEDVSTLMAAINSELLELEGQRDRGGPVPISEVVTELWDDVEVWQNDPLPVGGVRGLSTGIQEWDTMMGGMANGESLVVLAARPRSGKSALALTSAYRLAKQGKRVLFFALEMKAKTLLARVASAESKVEYKKVQRGSVEGSSWYASGEEFSRFMSGVIGAGAANNLYIDESMNLSASQIRSRSLVLARKLGGLDLIVVDTGNLVQSERDSGKNFAQVESDKVRQLRNLVKELDCVAYVTWQLNKGVDSRATANMGRMPTLGDLRDTGGVEEHASDVIGLYRDELYNENSPYKNVMHLTALKRRDDVGGTKALLGFDPQFQRFYAVEIERKPL